MACRKVVLQTLQICKFQLEKLSKEITSSDVPGLMLAREHLAGRRKQRRKRLVYGQKQEEPITNKKVTPPAGMGINSDNPNVDSFYQ